MQDATEAPEGRSSGIQVIARAAQLLRAIKDAPGGMTQSELSVVLGLPRSTVHRILSALEDEEMVVPGTGPRGRYRIGPEVSRLASAAQRALVWLVHPLIEELSAEVAETVDVSVLDGSQITFIDQVDAPHRLRAASAVGESFPLHSCAPGKALLATLSPSRLSEILPARLVASTPRTVTSMPALREELDEIRRTGIAWDREEQNDGICAVGIALVVGGAPVAVSIPIPAQRFDGRERDCVEALLAFRERVLLDTPG